MAQRRLTDYLLSRYKTPTSGEKSSKSDGLRPESPRSKLWTEATQHTFLVKAGQGRVPDNTLAQWFAQDIHYTRAYVQFIGGLLLRLRLPTKISSLLSSVSTGSGDGQEQGVEKNIQHRAFDVLVAALTGIQREMQFFEDTIHQHGLDATYGKEKMQILPHTKAYVDLLQSVGHGSASLLDGLTVLWATEYVYLQAWSFAKSQKVKSESKSQQNEEAIDGEASNCARARAALHGVLIDNWSSPEFASFVEQCRIVLDDWALAEGVNIPESFEHSLDPGTGTDISATSRDENKTSEKILRAQEWFDQIVWLEGRFWPQSQ